MAVPTEHRIRPPKDKETLIQRLLLDTKEGPFETRYQVLVFAASLGWANSRREPLEAAGEGIRYELFRRHGTIEAFIDSLGVLSTTKQGDELIVDASIMDASQLQKRINVFEEYANGGLALIQGELNRGVRPMDVILELCRKGSTRDTDRLAFMLPPLSSPDLS
jgi:dnd system-associated protein 4